MQTALLGCIRTVRHRSGDSVRFPNDAIRMRLPEAHDAVLVERFVDAHDCELAFKCLGGKQAIKRIAMVKWQRRHARDVADLDRE